MTTKTKPHRSARTDPPSPFIPWGSDVVRVVVIAVTAGVLLIFHAGLHDIYITPKVAFVVLGTLGLLVVNVWSATSTGAITVVRSWAVPLLGAVIALMALSALLADFVTTSFLGEYGRGGGVLLYLCGAVLFTSLLTHFGERSVGALVNWCAGAGAVVVAYGLMQTVNVRPFGSIPSDPVISTLGQVNFVAGVIGIMIPLFLWVSVHDGSPKWARVFGAAAILGALVLVPSTKSFQAYVALFVGVLLFALVFAHERLPARVVKLSALGVVVIGMLVLAIGWNRIESEVNAGLNERLLMWEAAADMVQDRPILGHGPSGFSAQFSKYRPAEHARLYGIFQLVDAPHSVPLSMFVAGGFLLGAAYLIFVGYIGWTLVTGLRATRGERRLLLAGVGAAWLAYQVQSTISIDVPTLIVLHFVLAGCIVVIARQPAVRTFAIPGLVSGSHRGRRQPTTLSRAVQLAVLVGALFAAWHLAIRPVGAAAAFARAEDARASADWETAIEETARATDLAPWVAQYWAIRAATLAEVGDQEAALAAGSQAADRQPSAVSYTLSAAHLAQAMGRADVADRYYLMAIENAPKIPQVYHQRASFLVLQKRYEEAIPLYQYLIDLDGVGIQFRLELGDLYMAMGEEGKARQMYESVIELDPNNENARHALGLPPIT